ncbi:MAG: GFA family protein [Gammaproteobacteria bacterium]|nr:GFA family protein [Gammaproteobacteria bacterium]
MGEQRNAHDGHCACGFVRYRMHGAPLFVHCCHCRWCQRESGSAFALNAMIESDRVELRSGEVARVALPSHSGKGQTVLRCPRCQVALWSHYAGAGEAISFVRVGTLEAPDRVPPDIHIYTESKQPWVVLPDGVAAVTAFYRASEHWPADSLKRRDALRAKQQQQQQQ